MLQNVLASDLIILARGGPGIFTDCQLRAVAEILRPHRFRAVAAVARPESTQLTIMVQEYQIGAQPQ